MATEVSVHDFGAYGDGVTDDQASIQAAIDYVMKSGGGRVVFPKGDYRLGSLLRSNEVELYFVSGAQPIQGSVQSLPPDPSSDNEPEDA